VDKGKVNLIPWKVGRMNGMATFLRRQWRIKS